MAINKDKFMKSINDFYTQEMLYRLFTHYFIDWIADGYIGNSLGLLEVSMVTENTNKQLFLDLVEQSFGNMFLTLFEKLEPDVQETFTKVVWENNFFIAPEVKDDYFKMESGYDPTKDLKDKFQFFRATEIKNSGFELTLDYNIIRMLRKSMKKPKEYDLIPLSEIEDTSLKYDNNEQEIVDNFKKYFEFYRDGNIKISNSSKLLKASKVNMKKYCKISEYYEDAKDLDYLKTEIIALFFELGELKYRKDDEYFKITNIRQILENFLDGTYPMETNYHYSSLFLNYLKGVKNINEQQGNLKKCLLTIKDLVEKMPTDIISMDNIIKYILFRDEFIELIDPVCVTNYIYINEANYERTKIVGYDEYIEYITKPFIKSVFFILSALGIFEVYYAHPTPCKSLYLKNGYLNKFDGIRYVKFTELGKYALKIIDEYDFGDSQNSGEVFLDDTNLIATVCGNLPTQFMYLQKVAQKITNNSFKFSDVTFLKGVNNLEDIKVRIEEFYDKIESNPPQIWTQFFDDILNRSSAISVNDDFVILQLDSKPELLKLISKDKQLKKLALKGEGCHLLVKKENIEKVENILAEYGYPIFEK